MDSPHWALELKKPWSVDLQGRLQGLAVYSDLSLEWVLLGAAVHVRGEFFWELNYLFAAVFILVNCDPGNT